MSDSDIEFESNELFVGNVVINPRIMSKRVIEKLSKQIALAISRLPVDAPSVAAVSTVFTVTRSALRNKIRIRTYLKEMKRTSTMFTLNIMCNEYRNVPSLLALTQDGRGFGGFGVIFGSIEETIREFCRQAHANPTFVWNLIGMETGMDKLALTVTMSYLSSFFPRLT